MLHAKVALRFKTPTSICLSKFLGRWPRNSLQIPNNPAFQTMNKSAYLCIEWRTEWSYAGLCYQKVIHQLLAIFANIIGGVLKANLLLFHEDGNDIVAVMTFSLFHIVGINILTQQCQWEWVIRSMEATYISPANKVASCIKKLPENWILINLIRKVCSMSVFNEAKTVEHGAVVATKSDVRLDVQHKILFP